MRKIILLFFIAVISFGKAEAQVLKSDSLALVDLYNSCNGAHWLGKWKLTNPIKTWRGIDLSSDGSRVTLISIGGDELRVKGTLPSSLGNFSALLYLQISDTHITGKIPSSIGNLYNLQELYFGDNQLSGKLPATLSKLSNLNTIDLSGNKLSGSIDVLGKVKNLGSIALAGNHFTGTIDSLSNLSNLGDLDLRSCQLTGSLTSLGELKNLGSIYLSYNHFTGSIPDSFINFAYSGNISLDHNQLSGNIPMFKNKLVYIDINDNKYTFNSIEEAVPRMDTMLFEKFTYAPQGTIPLHYNNAKLSVTAGGTLSNDTFRLYKNGMLLKIQIGDSAFANETAGDYYMTITNRIAKQLTLHSDTFTIGASFARKEIANNPSLSLYPNPAKDKINIVINASQNESAEIIIVDMNGKIVSNFNTQITPGTITETINVSKLAKGNYFVEIKTDEGSRSEKFVKE